MSPDSPNSVSNASRTSVREWRFFITGASAAPGGCAGNGGLPAGGRGRPFLLLLLELALLADWGGMWMDVAVPPLWLRTGDFDLSRRPSPPPGPAPRCIVVDAAAERIWEGGGWVLGRGRVLRVSKGFGCEHDRQIDTLSKVHGDFGRIQTHSKTAGAPIDVAHYLLRTSPPCLLWDWILD